MTATAPVPGGGAAPLAGRLVIWPKRIVYLAAGTAVLWVCTRLGLTLLLSGIVAGALVASIEGLLRLLVARRIHRFEGALLGAMRARSPDLLGLYERERLLRFAAPRHYSLGKLGLIQSRLGLHAAAVAALEEALEDAPQARVYALRLLLADALFEAGQGEAAERLYREILALHEGSARAFANLSRLVLARSGDPDEARALLERAAEIDRGVPLKVELVLLLARIGRLDEARELLAAAEVEHAATADEEDRSHLASARASLEAARETAALS